MSFLKELLLKKGKLKPVTTIITYPDGSQAELVAKRSVEGNYSSLSEEKSIDSKTKCGFVIDTKPDPVPACILPKILYLGSQDAVIHSNFEQFGITDILSIGIDTPLSAEDRLNINCHFLPCLDLPETPLKPILEQAIEIIDSVRKRHGCILVHCNAGVSRSATICIGYLIRIECMTFDDAYQFVRLKRESARPNDGFLKQLKLFK